MPIDFHDIANANTYATRLAEHTWFAQMRDILKDKPIGRVADIGCGGGIYSRAWQELGAKSVIGIDSSAQMIADARAITTNAAVDFRIADAYATGLDDASVDIVFSRAVVHHLDDHEAAMREALRALAPGGRVIVQDRTMEDVLQPVSPGHFRAHFFASFPRLLEAERQRRPLTNVFRDVLLAAGFTEPDSRTFWEDRRTYQNDEELREELLSRTGRSILHELDDDELTTLTDTIIKASEGHFPLSEVDRRTIWTARKPVES